MSPENEPKEPTAPASIPVPEDQLISADTLDVGTEHRPDEIIGADNDNEPPYSGGRHLEEEGERIIAAHAGKDKPGRHTQPFFAGTNIKVLPKDFAGDEHTAIDRISGAVARVEWREAA